MAPSVVATSVPAGGPAGAGGAVVVVVDGAVWSMGRGLGRGCCSGRRGCRRRRRRRRSRARRRRSPRPPLPPGSRSAAIRPIRPPSGPKRTGRCRPQGNGWQDAGHGRAAADLVGLPLRAHASASAAPSGWATRVVVSGTGPVVPDGRCPEDAADQARRCFDIIDAALAEAGASLDDVVRTRMYITAAADDADAVGAVHGELLGARPPGRDHGRRGGTAGPRLEGGDRSRGGALLRRRAAPSPSTVAATMLAPRRSPTTPASMRFIT